VLDLVQIHSLNGVDVLFPQPVRPEEEGQIRYVGITTSNGPARRMTDLINSQTDRLRAGWITQLANRDGADNVLPARAGQTCGRTDQYCHSVAADRRTACFHA
jgi:hypothetical protein